MVSRWNGVVDCGVVGGDPAALVFALLLARRGWRVRVVERGERRDARLAGVSPFLSPPSLELFDGLGLLDVLLEAGTPVREMVEYSPDGGSVLDYGERAEGRFPYALSVPLLTLTETVREALAREATVEVSTQTPVRGIKDSEDTVILELADGEAVECRFAVCADGKFSKVRDLAGISADVVEFDRLLAMVVIPAPPGWPGEIAARHADRGSLVTTVPLAGNRMIVQWLAAPEEFEQVRSADVAELRSRLTRVLPELAEPLAAVLTGWDRVLIIRHHVVQPEVWSRGRVGLLGDSAHGVHSFAGQALNLGIQDAMVLGSLLVEGGSVVFAEYERVRRPFVERFQRYQLSLPQLTSQPAGGNGRRDLYGEIADLMARGQPEAEACGRRLIRSNSRIQRT